MATRVGIRELRTQQGDLSDRERLLEAGRLMQLELERLGLTEDELSSDFKAWSKQRQQSQAYSQNSSANHQSLGSTSAKVLENIKSSMHTPAINQGQQPAPNSSQFFQIK